MRIIYLGFGVGLFSIGLIDLLVSWLLLAKAADLPVISGLFFLGSIAASLIVRAHKDAP